MHGAFIQSTFEVTTIIVYDSKDLIQLSISTILHINTKKGTLVITDKEFLFSKLKIIVRFPLQKPSSFYHNESGTHVQALQVISHWFLAYICIQR